MMLMRRLAVQSMELMCQMWEPWRILYFAVWRICAHTYELIVRRRMTGYGFHCLDDIHTAFWGGFEVRREGFIKKNDETLAK